MRGIKKVRIVMISLDRQHLKETYDELCQALKPRVEYSEDELQMAKQALFIKDKALNAICNFLYNSGIQQPTEPIER